MKKFQILCTTMKQKDFSKLEEMKIHSNIIYANQDCENRIDFYNNDGLDCLMVTTNTIGVGNNRNIALLYADAEICLLADDDVVYYKDYEKNIIEQFNKHPEADVIIFNLNTSTPEYGRRPTEIKKFKKFHRWQKNPYGAPRIAFRLSEIRKKNVFFSTFFGGGCIFKSGEDTIWINQICKSGLKVFLSPIYIGEVSYHDSTSFMNDEKEKLYTKGAMLEAENDLFSFLKMYYYIFFNKNKEISFFESYRLIKAGKQGYKMLESYDKFLNK